MSLRGIVYPDNYPDSIRRSLREDALRGGCFLTGLTKTPSWCIFLVDT